MHELGIAHSLVEAVIEAPPDPAKDRVVRLRLGVLAGVVRGALEFCYTVATEGTPIAGSTLEIQEIPVRIYCGTCAKEVDPEQPLLFRCAICGAASADIRKGKELELESVEVDNGESEGQDVHTGTRDPQGNPQQK